MIKNIIIILLILIIIYLSFSSIRKFFKNAENEYYSSKLLNIKFNLDKNIIQRDIIQKEIDENLIENIQDKKLRKITEYALEDGKKVRPIIFKSIANKLSQNKDININKMALSVEYIHTASLIIDDIMDDDDFRRGKLSLHTKYNLNIALIIAILLMSLGQKNIYSNLKEQYEKYPDTNKDITLIIGELYSGILNDLTVGQFHDINDINDINGNNNITNTELIIHKKTSSLFEYCFCVPYILANYNKTTEELNEGIIKMKEMAKTFGLMFQIADDFEDYLKDLDKESNVNYVIKLGFTDAYEKYKKIVSDFTVKSTNEGILTDELIEIEGYLTKKVKAYYDDNMKN